MPEWTARSRQIIAGSLGCGLVGVDGTREFAPEIQLPAGVQTQREVVVDAAAARHILAIGIAVVPPPVSAREPLPVVPSVGSCAARLLATAAWADRSRATAWARLGLPAAASSCSWFSVASP